MKFNYDSTMAAPKMIAMLTATFALFSMIDGQTTINGKIDIVLVTTIVNTGCRKTGSGSRCGPYEASLHRLRETIRNGR